MNTFLLGQFTVNSLTNAFAHMGQYTVFVDAASLGGGGGGPVITGDNIYRMFPTAASRYFPNRSKRLFPVT